MLQYLFDTDHLTLYQHQHPQVILRMAASAQGVAVSPPTVEEALRGRLAVFARAVSGQPLLQAYQRLMSTMALFHQLTVVAFDVASEMMLQQLKVQRLRIGTLDLRIAAVALANQLTLVTRNRRDFGRIPGLVLEDWSV